MPVITPGTWGARSPGKVRGIISPVMTPVTTSGDLRSWSQNCSSVSHNYDLTNVISEWWGSIVLLHKLYMSRFVYIKHIYFILPVLVEWETFWECSINKGDTTQTGVLECATFLVYCFIFYLTVSIVFRRDKVGSNELCGRHKIISHNFPGSTGAGSGPDQGLGQNIDAIITMVSKMNEAVKQLEQHHHFRFNRQGKIQTS